MKKITFDSGLRKYELGNGILCFNPLDPNLYERFMQAADKFTDLEKELVAKAQKEKNGNVLGLMKSFDKEAKALLNGIFGPGNDFDKMLGGINLMAVADNGERVITNLMNALTPILEQGAKECASSFVNKGVK